MRIPEINVQWWYPFKMDFDLDFTLWNALYKSKFVAIYNV